MSEHEGLSRFLRRLPLIFAFIFVIPLAAGNFYAVHIVQKRSPANIIPSFVVGVGSDFAFMDSTQYIRFYTSKEVTKSVINECDALNGTRGMGKGNSYWDQKANDILDQQLPLCMFSGIDELGDYANIYSLYFQENTILYVFGGM